MHATHTHTLTQALGVPPHQSGTKWDKTYHVSSQWEQTLLTHCSLEALTLGPTTAMRCLTRASEQGCARRAHVHGCMQTLHKHSQTHIHTYRYVDTYICQSHSFSSSVVGALFNPLISHNTLKSKKTCIFFWSFLPSVAPPNFRLNCWLFHMSVIQLSDRECLLVGNRRYTCQTVLQSLSENHLCWKAQFSLHKSSNHVAWVCQTHSSLSTHTSSPSLNLHLKAHWPWHHRESSDVQGFIPWLLTPMPGLTCYGAPDQNLAPHLPSFVHCVCTLSPPLITVHHGL